MSVGTTNGRTARRLTALVVDDEPTAREYLKLVLTRVGGVSISDEAASGAECLSKVADASPDVVFLDIHLPDMSGVEIARSLTKLKDPPQIVFVTGYDEYAVPAFELAAVDYLTKPFSQERLEKTIARLRDRLGRGASGPAEAPLPTLDKLPIRSREGCKLVDLKDICYIQTRNRKTLIYTASGTHVSHYTLSELEQKLNGKRFFRANEGCLVNLDRVKEVVRFGSRSYELLLTEPKDTLIPLSRSRAQGLWGVLGLQ